MRMKRRATATHVAGGNARPAGLAACLVSILALAPGAAWAQCELEWSDQFPAGTFDGIVYALTVFDDGSGSALYVGGAFTSAGGVAVNRIARWDGTSWSALGAGMSSTVFALAVFDDDGPGPNLPALYAGGDFTSAGGLPANRIAKWNGQSWSPVGSGMGGVVYTLAVFDADGAGAGLDALYAGGGFVVAGGTPAKRIAKWNGSTWSPLGTGPDNGMSDYVRTLAVFDDDDDGPNAPALYLGGGFWTAGEESARRVARWDGTTWSSLRAAVGEPDGVNSTVYKLFVFDDDGPGPHKSALYLGGSFTKAGETVNASRIVKWDGSGWTPLAGGLDLAVWSLTAFDADGDGPGLPVMYAGGAFTMADGAPANYIARWNGTAWSTVGNGMDSIVYAMTAYDDDGAGPYLPALYAGGAFTTAGGVSSEHLGRWGCPLNNSPPVIARQPESRTVCSGTSATFSVSAWGTRPLEFQWRKDREAIEGAIGAVYTIDSADPNDIGSYDVVVTNTFGTATSNPATLTIGAAVEILLQPQSQEECAGGAITLSVIASGLAPLTYQWYRDDLVLYGATTSSYTIDPLKPNSGGVFTVTVSNACGTVMSDPATITVGSNPYITASPEPATVCEGGSVTFSVTAIGLPPFTYHWRKDGELISQANTASYTLNPVEIGDAGTYEVEVLDLCGATLSTPAVLTVNPKPIIETAPQPQTVCAGAAVTLSVTAGGAEPLTYQWRKDGQPIADANYPTYTVDPVAATDAGAYDVVVTNPCGSRTSTVAALTVVPGTLVQQHPQSQTACAGTAVTFSVSAEGLPPLAYQWRKDGQTIDGALESTLSINPVSTTDAGNYDVIITSGCGPATSDPATLVVQTGPSIQVPPLPQAVCLGGKATFTAVADGTDPLAYQWRRNGQTIDGAGSATLVIDPVTSGDAGQYDVVVTNGCGTATSAKAGLTVDQGPGVLTQPHSQAACPGTEVTFAVTADGTAPLTYRWRKDGQEIPDALAASLTLPSVTAGDAGQYDVVVTNSCGSQTSEVATLTVRPGTQITQHPEPRVVCPGSAVTFNVTATGTEPLTYEWRKNGQEIPNTNVPSYTLNAVTAQDAGQYDVVVHGACGTATSSAASLTVNAGPVIVTQPQSQTSCLGGEVAFHVGADGTAPLKYQWRKNGQAIDGATGAAYVLHTVTVGDVGPYDVVVTNDCGAETSNEVALTLAAATTILQDPQPRTACAGGTVAFTVSASGAEPITYVWRKDGQVIDSATGATYQIERATLSDAGTYDVVVTGACGPATSAGALLVVNADVNITEQPQTQSVCAGTTVVFRVVAEGSGTLTYQWRKDGAAIDDAIEATYTLDSVALPHIGIYDVVVTGTCGSLASHGAALTLDAGVTITQQPQAQSVCAGTSATFSITADGSGTLTYQWRKDGTTIDDALDATYHIASCTPEQAGQYDVVVTGLCGVLVSEAATLQIRNCAPALVTPASPEPPSGATSVPPNLLLRWADVAGATTYEVYFGPIPTPPRLGTTAVPNWSVQDLTAATTYYWRVVAKNAAASVDGPLWSFTTAQPSTPADPNDDPGGGVTPDDPGTDKPEPPDDGGSTDPNQATQDPAADPNDSAQDQPTLPNCGAGSCGAGSLGLTPLTVLAISGMKLRHRRRSRAL